MSGIIFTDEFKRDAVAQVVDRGYSVAEVSERLGISTKSLYTWKTQFSQPRKTNPRYHRTGRGDQAVEERIGPRIRGARHTKKNRSGLEPACAR